MNPPEIENMLTKTSSASAFFNVRALRRLFFLSSGVFLGLAGTGSLPTLLAQKNQPVEMTKAAPELEFSPADEYGRLAYPTVFPVPFRGTSQKMHGSVSAGVPLNHPDTEPRSGGPTNDYTLVVEIDDPNISFGPGPQASVTQGQGTIGSNGTSSGGAVSHWCSFIVNQCFVTIPLTNVASRQTINVRLNDVRSSQGNGSVDVALRVLVGDTNRDGVVNAGDALQTRSRAGQPVDLSTGTWRSDVNADGTINAGDTIAVRSRAGDSL